MCGEMTLVSTMITTMWKKFKNTITINMMKLTVWANKSNIKDEFFFSFSYRSNVVNTN